MIVKRIYRCRVAPGCQVPKLRAWKLTPGTNFSVGSRAAIERMEAVEHADAGGERTDRMLRGDAAVVRERRERAAASSRSRAAVQAALDKIALPKAAAPIKSFLGKPLSTKHPHTGQDVT